MADGRKKAWYVKKIEALEAKVGEFDGMNHNRSYAQGFHDALAKYGVLSKAQRRRLKERLELEGPGAAKNSKRSRVNFPFPSF